LELLGLVLQAFASGCDALVAAVPNQNVNLEDVAYSYHRKDIQCLMFVMSLKLNDK
jgi:hypothetical protein